MSLRKSITLIYALVTINDFEKKAMKSFNFLIEINYFNKKTNSSQRQRQTERETDRGNQAQTKADTDRDRQRQRQRQHI